METRFAKRKHESDEKNIQTTNKYMNVKVVLNRINFERLEKKILSTSRCNAEQVKQKKI